MRLQVTFGPESQGCPWRHCDYCTMVRTPGQGQSSYSPELKRQQTEGRINVDDSNKNETLWHILVLDIYKISEFFPHPHLINKSITLILGVYIMCKILVWRRMILFQSVFSPLIIYHFTVEQVLIWHRHSRWVEY